ncbi:MAG TPA: plastocyanin/azurin family copper-binding protein [Ilumatobacteraceae bacterium]|nr:plastocyanin/azurin family copper-binding protein [Ilumatobacteraceae bacterium]
MSIRRSFAGVFVAAVVAAGCASDSSDVPGASNEGANVGSDMGTVMDPNMDMSSHDADSFNFGEPATQGEANRVVKIQALDTLTFNPATITVAAGETITFAVTNSGALAHDFTLGDAALQVEHEAEMASMSADMMMDMADEPNAFSLPPGATKELTWRFDAAATVIFGCHVPGHYAAGMRGVVEVG